MQSTTPSAASAERAWAGATPPGLRALALGRAFSQYRRDLAPYLPAARSARILDFGCGWGAFLAFLAREGYAEFEGLDVDARCVDFCRQQIGPVAHYAENSTTFLAERPSAYDAIVMRGVACYLPLADRVACFAAAYAALRPGGRLIIQEYNGALFTGSYPRYNDHHIVTVFTEHSLRWALEEAGLQVLAIRGATSPGRGARHRVWRTGQRLWGLALRFVYTLERGLDASNPSILDRDLIAVGSREA